MDFKQAFHPSLAFGFYVRFPVNSTLAWQWAISSCLFKKAVGAAPPVSWLVVFSFKSSPSHRLANAHGGRYVRLIVTRDAALQGSRGAICGASKTKGGKIGIFPLYYYLFAVYLRPL